MVEELIDLAARLRRSTPIPAALSQRGRYHA
jgi:hypothetical protein